MFASAWEVLALGAGGSGVFAGIETIRWRVRTYSKRLDKKWREHRGAYRNRALDAATHCRRWAKRYGNANDHASRAVMLNAAELFEALAESWREDNWPQQPNQTMLPVPNDDD